VFCLLFASAYIILDHSAAAAAEVAGAGSTLAAAVLGHFLVKTTFLATDQGR
jgi:hypothetical protein